MPFVAELSTAERRNLPRSDFVFPDRAPGPGSYPIPDENHARDALARVEADGSTADQIAVRHKVHERFPEIKTAEA